jgi:curved DNA-binding protein CbpA
MAMRDFYSVLQVAPKASDGEIKAAFRTLAKTCHPDLKPGDRQAEETFQEAQRAYAFLSNSETRKRYDAFLAERRAVERQRRLRSAMTMAATFVLTAGIVILTMLWLNLGSLPFGGGHLSAGAAERVTPEVAGAPAAAPTTTDTARSDPRAERSSRQ